MATEEPKLCTTSGEPVEKVRTEQIETEGQHKAYIVLCTEERAKGFVRPYRDSYQHVGRLNSHWKGVHRMLTDEEKQKYPTRDYVAVMTIITNEDGTFKGGAYTTQKELDAWRQQERVGGCGAVTKMGRALSETYARDPKFYGATFCCYCNTHLPVTEFIWTADGKTVGT